jgi:hypothetical protein
MADNSVFDPGAGGDTYRSKDRAGVKTEIVGLDIGIGGTETLMTAAALADTTANPTTAPWAGMLMCFNGTTWDRLRGDTTNGIFANVKTSVLPTGASTSAKQPALGTAGSASTDVITVQGIASMTALKVDGSAVTQPVSGTVTANLSSANVTNAGTFAVQDSQKVVDNAGFTDGTTPVNPVGFIFDEVAGTALTENDAAAARVDSKRAQVLVLEDATTRGQRATVSAANALKVDGSAVTQPVRGGDAERQPGAGRGHGDGHELRRQERRHAAHGPRHGSAAAHERAEGRRLGGHAADLVGGRLSGVRHADTVDDGRLDPDDRDGADDDGEGDQVERGGHVRRLLHLQPELRRGVRAGLRRGDGRCGDPRLDDPDDGVLHPRQRFRRRSGERGVLERRAHGERHSARVHDDRDRLDGARDRPRHDDPLQVSEAPMSVGFPTDKGTIDQRVASLAWQLRSTFDQIQVVKAWLDSQTDAQLTAIGYSGSATSGEIQILRTAYTDLSNLGKVAHAQATQATANDFFFWASKLLGVQ